MFSCQAPTYATGGAAVCPGSVSPPINGVMDLIFSHSGLPDRVLVLYAWVLLLKQQLDSHKDNLSPHTFLNKTFSPT